MNVLLPQRLSLSAYVELANREFARTAAQKNAVVFDWRQTRWIDLPALAAVLIWSSALRNHKPVTWLMQNPLERPQEVDEYGFAAELEVGSQTVRRYRRTLNALSTKLANQTLYPRERREALASLCKDVKTATLRWLQAETHSWDAADLLGYLHRYGVLAQALARGIEIVPHPDITARSKMARGSDSASMAFRPIASALDVERTASDLSDWNKVEKILGRYADLEMVKRGALASILVTELGSNVTEHANASGAWLTSRAVTGERLREHGDDPVANVFAATGRGFLEVLVCDDGCGLTKDLDRVLAREKRRSVHERYGLANGGKPEIHHLIDYAFDRFASTKRNLHEIVQGSAGKPPTLGVASGLYWIWNFARTHGAVISATTGGVSMTYDFANQQRTANELPKPQNIPTAGTLIRIAVPLADIARPVAPQESPGEELPNAPPPPIAALHYANVADFARVRPIQPLRGPQLMFTQWDEGMLLMQRLIDRHAQLHDGDVLLLDLTGSRRPWNKTSAEPVCRFFLEANYTSTSGRSATVLWNVPERSRDVFEEAIRVALEDYSRLITIHPIRRAALVVTASGQPHIVTASSLIRTVLKDFGDEPARTLAELGIDALNEEDRATVITFFRDNDHLFEWVSRGRAETDAAIHIRAWPSTLRRLPWREAQKWFEEKLNTSYRSGGILARKAVGEGFYRLPSSELFSRDFYHFRGFLSNTESLGRTSWMLAQIIRELARQHGSVDTIVALSRPTMLLATAIADAVAESGLPHPNLVTAETLEVLHTKLGPDHKPLRNALFLLTAVSTGRLSNKVAALLNDRGTRWIGTITCLDARGEAVAQPRPYTLAQDVESVECSPAGGTGPVYPLAIREVAKYSREDVGTEPVVSIDAANLCPIHDPPPPRPSRNPEKPVWDFLDPNGTGFHVGHFHSGDYHHYLYYVDADRLLMTPRQRNLLEYTVEQMLDDLAERVYHPDSIIIFYPPREESGGAIIGHAIQEHLGALYEFALHRDFFGGEWRFSPYADHGLPLKNATVILVDDGSNTGDTLMGLLHAATHGKPARILAYIGLQRLPPHKLRLLTSLRRLAECEDVKIWFGARLSIPVFSPRTCPVCRLRHQLARVRDASPLLRTVTNDLMKALESVGVTREPEPRFLWTCRDRRAAGMLREDLEVFEYNTSADQRLEKRVTRVLHNIKGCADDLRDLAFVVCMEPELAKVRAISRNAAQLFACVRNALATCALEEIVTLACFAFYLTAYSDVTPADREDAQRVETFAAELLALDTISPRAIGEIVAVIAGDHFSEETSAARPAITDVWLSAISSTANARVRQPHLVAKETTAAFAAFYALGAGASMAASEPPEEADHASFFDFVRRVASDFHWHAVANTISNVDKIHDALVRNEWTADRLVGPIHTLIRSLNGLEELRRRIRDLERGLLKSIAEKTSMTAFWYTAPIQVAIGSIAEALLILHELSQSQLSEHDRIKAEKAVRTLSTETRDLLHHLKTPFDLLLPEVTSSVQRDWKAFIHTPDGERFAQVPIESPEVDAGWCVFLPEPLIDRFLSVALGNLQTAAFLGIPSATIERTTCRLRLGLLEGSGRHPCIAVDVIDNGPEFPDRMEAEKRVTQGRGLDDLNKMAGAFSGEVERRRVDNETVTSLVMLAHKRPSPRLATTEGL